MIISTLWLNNENKVPTTESISLVKKFIMYMKKYAPEDQIKLFVHLDMGLFKRFFGDEIEVIPILDICPEEQKVIYEEGNCVTTMVDHGKHLIVSNFLNVSDKVRCAVLDIDIREDLPGLRPIDWKKVDLSYYKLRDNNENQFYLFESGDEDLYLRHYSIYVQKIGEQYAKYAREGRLKLDAKRAIMSNFIEEANRKAEHKFEVVANTIYFDMYNILFGTNEESLDKHMIKAFINEIWDIFLPSTTLHDFYEETEYHEKHIPKGQELRDLDLPFECTEFSRKGLNKYERAIIHLLKCIK